MDLSAAGAAVSLPPPRCGDWRRVAVTPDGVLYRRRLVDLGGYVHPATGSELHVDLKMLDTLRCNFAGRVTGHVPVQVENSDDPVACVGEVVALETAAGGLDVLCDVRAGGPPAGSVAGSVSLDYPSNRGVRVGPALLRVVLLGRDFRRDLDEVTAATYERFAPPATDDIHVGLAAGPSSRSSRAAGLTLISPAAPPPGDGGAPSERTDRMSEYGPVRASYEVDRLTKVAEEMGFVRKSASAAEPSRHAVPGTVDGDVARYIEMAEELGVSGSRSRAPLER